MKKILINAALILSSTLLVAPAFAHDPAEHAKTAEAPDCEAMKTMDHSKMDMNDPVMQALMKKCGGTHNEHGDQHQGTDHRKATGTSKAASSANHEGHGSH